MSMLRRPARMMPLADAVEHLFQDALRPLASRGAAGAMPALDVSETNDAYVIEAEVPGASPDEIEITLEGTTVLIHGQYGARGEEENERSYLLRERRGGRFARSVTLPGEVDGGAVSCTYENGELRITLPKAPQHRARRIEITGAGPRSVGEGPGSTPRDDATGGAPAGAASGGTMAEQSGAGMNPDASSAGSP